jgi:hypothetical protein
MRAEVLLSLSLNTDIRLVLSSERSSTSTTLLRPHDVGIATRYGLDGLGIEIRWGRTRFSARVQTAPGAHPSSVQRVERSFLGVKWRGPGLPGLL